MKNWYNQFIKNIIFYYKHTPELACIVPLVLEFIQKIGKMFYSMLFKFINIVINIFVIILKSLFYVSVKVLNFFFKICFILFKICFIAFKICFIVGLFLWFLFISYFIMCENISLIDLCSPFNWIWIECFSWINSLNLQYSLVVDSKKNLFLVNLFIHICLFNFLLKSVIPLIKKKFYLIFTLSLFWVINCLLIFYIFDTFVGIYCCRLDFCSLLNNFHYTGIFNHNLFTGFYLDIKLHWSLEERLFYFNYLLDLNNISSDFFSETQILTLITLDPSDMYIQFNDFYMINYLEYFTMDYKYNRAIIRGFWQTIVIFSGIASFIFIDPPILEEIALALYFIF